MANLDQPKALRQYLLAKPDVTESFPFGDDVAVFKVRNKMFALFGIEEGVVRLNLKCDPDEACALRDIYPSVIPGYHMNKCI
ncbi:MmcQ/YjbR family DNA-binding protein [Corallincola holothuriorum]|uniref:MmcQ/YjbR family DNA-binding protein n=1 Tax=Corallincola holothuriorum TaxID=2282215 RepID=UPI00269507F6|nr:MmcQ/YjbR family DNA-binding protein [Corallincola holothuriorum]